MPWGDKEAQAECMPAWWTNGKWSWCLWGLAWGWVRITDSCRKGKAREKPTWKRWDHHTDVPENRSPGGVLWAGPAWLLWDRVAGLGAKWVQNENVGLLVSRRNISKWHWQSFKLNRGPSPVDPVCRPNWKGLILFPRGWNPRNLPSLDALNLQGSLQVCFSFSTVSFFLAFFFFNSAASCINILQFPYEKFPRGPC